jgi:hypothetical protein
MSSSVLIRHRGLVMNPDESCAEWRGHAVGLTAIPRRQSTDISTSCCVRCRAINSLRAHAATIIGRPPASPTRLAALHC